MESNNMMIGRQPILDNSGAIHAYELLFRSSSKNFATISDDTQATARVLINTLNSFGIENLIGNCKGFININKTFLLSDMIETIPKDQFVLELLETVEVDEDVVNRVKDLKTKGYTIAIDDYDFAETLENNFEPIFEYADILKIDLMACEFSKVKESIGYFKNKNLKLLAEKVETLEEFEACKEIGFDYYQGYFFGKPSIIEGKSLDPSQSAVLELLGVLQSNKDIKDIEKSFMKYPDLTLNLLKYMNSSAFATKATITSISHAITLIGRVELAKWLGLFMCAGSDDNPFSKPLIQSALLRAKAMELVCKNILPAYKDKAYMVGIMSRLDSIYNMPIEEIIKGIPLDDLIVKALLNKEGPLGKLLFAIDIFEKGEFEKITKIKEKLKISDELYNSIIDQSYQWANNS